MAVAAPILTPEVPGDMTADLGAPLQANPAYIVPEDKLKRLPEQLRRTVMRDQQLLKQHLNIPDEQTPTPAEQAPTPAEQTPTPAEQPAVVPPPAPITPSVKQEAKEEEEPAPAKGVDYEAKYKSLQGKYNAEIPAMQRQLNQLAAQNRELQTRLDAVPAPTPVVNQSLEGILSEAEVEDLGPELAGVIAKTASAIAARATAPLHETIKQLTTRVGTVEPVAVRAAQTEREKMLDAVRAAVPDLEQLNTDAGFNDWLDEPDDFSGIARRVLLDNASLANDSRRVIAMFRGYKAVATPAARPTASATAPASADTPTPTPLDALVMPGKARTGSTAPAATDEPVPVRQSEVRQFQDDIARGKYKHDRAGYERDQARIDAAYRNGLVVPG